MGRTSEWSVVHHTSTHLAVPHGAEREGVGAGEVTTLRSTSNEPLRAVVVGRPVAHRPLWRNVQRHRWPATSESTSPSTSRRPSSVLTLSFQSAPALQLRADHAVVVVARAVAAVVVTRTVVAATAVTTVVVTRRVVVAAHRRRVVDLCGAGGADAHRADAQAGEGDADSEGSGESGRAGDRAVHGSSSVGVPSLVARGDADEMADGASTPDWSQRV